MKKLISILTVAVLIFSLVSCAKNSTSENSSVTGGSSQSESTKNDETQDTSQASDEESSSDTEQITDKKALIVYFSWSASGNTEKMANYIKEQIGGDIYEITAQNDYPTDYKECTDVALAERDNNERPAIKDLPDSIEEYDTILIGYPIWWHTAPMIIGTFLESYDLSGVDVYPFTQSASMDTTQFDNSMRFVRESAKGAAVHDGLFAEASDTESIQAYLTENGLVK